MKLIDYRNSDVFNTAACDGKESNTCLTDIIYKSLDRMELVFRVPLS
jgi:hypothetical protein